jgi:DNA-binding XRE family transcriptional regulator
MSAELGKTEGRERLSAAADNPSQFEIEIHCLEETVADEARDRWKSLTSGFHLEPSTEGVYADAERGVYSRVRELLRCSFDDLILEAWCAHEKRLAAECECDGCLARLSATPEADTGPGPVISGLRLPGDHSETLGQKVDRLRLNKGMTLEELAIEAGVDKKTVLRITKNGKRANPGTLKKLADALGVPASYLSS